MPLKHKWKLDSAKKFDEAQNSPLFISELDEILVKKYGSSTEECQSMNNDLIKCLINLADKALAKSKGLPNRFKRRWFDYECFKSKQNLARLAKRLPKHRYVKELSHAYYDQKKQHANLIKSKKTKYLFNLTTNFSQH